MSDTLVLEEFKTLGMDASFHYADDSASGEWRLGKVKEDNARKLFALHPHLEGKMQEISKRFIWSL